MTTIYGATPYNSYEYDRGKADTKTQEGLVGVSDEEKQEVYGGKISSSADQRQIVSDSSKLGKDEFLTLLIAEMQYQDPLDPISNQDSIAQLAQFSSLEQAENTTKAIQDLAEMMSGSQSSLLEGAQLIGKDVTALIMQENENGKEEEVQFTGQVMSVTVDNGNAKLKLIDETGKLETVDLKDVYKVEAS